LLAAMAVDTSHADFGALVTCNSYRNPELLADMARTIDHLSNGRFVLGIGSGWFERDYTEYGYEFGTAGGRLRDLDSALTRISDRLDKLTPPPPGHMPILIGGSGEKVTLRLVAEHADAWNTFGPPEHFKAKSAILDEWCARIGRRPDQIERTVAVQPNEVDSIDAYIDAGVRSRRGGNVPARARLTAPNRNTSTNTNTLPLECVSKRISDGSSSSSP
jgi:probable F420-dependent oxidoreductase